MTTKGSDYRLSPISNSDRKKAEAKKHNMDYQHSQAIAQDRVEDPEKYKRGISNKSQRNHKRKMVGLIGAVAAMGIYMDYPD